jgi:hypothetical protein
MPAYAYPITIKREPLKIRYHRSITLEDSTLTLALLRQYVTEEERFSIDETDEGLYSRTILSISGERYETEEEVKARVTKEERYMEEYNKRHKK